MKKFFYRVEEKDTVAFVANRFNCLLFYLIKENNLKCEIRKGDLLFIESIESELYTVKPTDTDEEIAKKFNTSIQEILEKNQAPYLFVGLKIIV